MADAAVSSESEDQSLPAKGQRTPTGWHKFWNREKSAAYKRNRTFVTQGNRVVQRFLDERSADGSREFGDDVPSRLNLFHKNVKTLSSMLYGNVPRIDVSREHHDPDDDVARVAATLFQRLLGADIAPSGAGLATVLKAALNDRLLPGLGTARVRYTFESEITEVEMITPEGVAMVEQESILNEEAPLDYVHWQDFLWGWARTWGEVPWVGFRSYLDKEEASERFSPELANQLEYKKQLPSGAQEQQEDTFESEQRDNVEKAEIWEFWCKKTRKVYWYSDGADEILDSRDDPLELDGFWPCPMPMAANTTTSLYMPKADYVIAQDQYSEIDVLQTRISIITRAVKVVGVYDASTGESVARMLNEGVDNTLIPVDNWAMFAEKGGLPGTIGWFPLADIVSALQALQGLQARAIEQLYEVTGMSDVMRGANTDQYTSDGTQQLKAKMGSIDVQALQEEFARFASDLEALKAEVVSKHFSPQTIAAQSNANYMPQADMPNVPPAIALMQSPDIKWRVNIRPESISMVDYAQLKAERTEFLTAMATYIQSASSAAQAMPGSLPVLLEMLKWGMAGFKGSNYLEGTMDAAIEMAKKQPPEQDKDGEKEKAAQQAEMGKIQAKAQADLQVIQAKSQAEVQKIQMDNQATLAEINAKNQGDIQKIVADLKADMQIIAAKLNADLNVEAAQSEFAMAERRVEHNDAMTEAAVEHRHTMAQIDEQGDQVRSEDD